MAAYNSLQDRTTANYHPLELQLALFHKAMSEGRLIDVGTLYPYYVLPESNNEVLKIVTGVKPEGRKLGVWINGKLRFQSRDSEAIHAYAAEKAKDFRNNVWLAPVGSFVDDGKADEQNARKAARIAKAAS